MGWNRDDVVKASKAFKWFLGYGKNLRRMTGNKIPGTKILGLTFNGLREDSVTLE